MASNYESIRDENRERYGTDIARIGPMLLADRYDDRTHFIFELLQNAEDALRRRGAWEGPRQVSFKLTGDSLTLSHFGRPFDDADVRGVCGIAKSTKDEHSIGRFGIGLKSVYTFTDCPTIHSGDEDFEIRNYVQPSKADKTDRDPEEMRGFRKEMSIRCAFSAPGSLILTPDLHSRQTLQNASQAPFITSFQKLN